MNHKHYTAWCAYMAFLLKERKLNQSSFADLMRVKPQVIQTYLSGRSKPPLDEMIHWCEVLKLPKHESERMRWLALESYTPSAVWEKIASLEAALTEMDQERVRIRAQLAQSEQERIRITSQFAEIRLHLSGPTAQQIKRT